MVNFPEVLRAALVRAGAPSCGRNSQRTSSNAVGALTCANCGSCNWGDCLRASLAGGSATGAIADGIDAMACSGGTAAERAMA